MLARAAPLAAALALAAPAASADPEVVASIRPVHALVAGVMEGVGTPALLVDGGQSPHSYALRPSDASRLEEAGLVVWTGPAVEPFLERPIDRIAGRGSALTLIELPGLTLLPVREGGLWEEHDHAHGGHGHGDHEHGDEGHAGHGHDDHAHDDHAHDDHAHDDHAHDDHGHDDHAHDDHAHDDHGHDDHAHDGHAHDGHAHDDHGHDDHAHDDHAHVDHAHGAGDDGAVSPASADTHIWLDPGNAVTMTRAIAERLAALDPGNAARYRDNADDLVARIEAADADAAARLAPVADRPFIVFHDAYQYLEAHYGLAGVGAITLSPERPPGARRLVEIRERIEEQGAVCLFREPQFAPDLVDTVTEGTDARVATLDPLGTALPEGPDAYPTLLRDLADSLADCLAPQG